MAERLSEMYTYASQAITTTNRPAAEFLPRLSNLKIRGLLVMALLAVMMLPVEQSVIAPASVIARQPFIITAPMDGVIDAVLVNSNEPIANGQRVVELDKTRLQNQVDVAEQVLKIARSKYTTTQQLSFADPSKKALLTPLRLQVEQQQAELGYAQQLLRRATIRSGTEGIAIFKDANELLGKPVQLGEKIMTIANPENIELEIDLAADDAIVMQPGARVALFLNIDPANVLHGELVHASYGATLTAQGTLAYRLLAKLDDTQPSPRIGLKGTAKLMGEQVRLYQYLFRRPITILRQTLGW